jgi:3-methyladenine DNA glycosylase/8-oxoguanine DNA glycosylase
VSTPEQDNLNKFMDKLKKSFGGLGGVGCSDLINHRIICDDPLVAELVFSMLVWESSIEHAIRASEKLNEQLIDLNELRVCTAEELSRFLPSRYPKSLERSQRLIAVLNRIFEKENKLSLSRLQDMNKRDVTEYFKSIEALPPFVSSRVILLGLGWHAFPIDDWLTKHLAKHGITDTSLDIHAQTQRMERLVRASDSLQYYTLLEHWALKQRSPKPTSNQATQNGQSTKSKPKSAATSEKESS